jgi:hypothetical protein
MATKQREAEKSDVYQRCKRCDRSKRKRIDKRSRIRRDKGDQEGEIISNEEKRRKEY